MKNYNQLITIREFGGFYFRILLACVIALSLVLSGINITWQSDDKIPSISINPLVAMAGSPIDVGQEDAGDFPSSAGHYTWISFHNPANDTGNITSVIIYTGTAEKAEVGSFYRIGATDNFSCRASATVITSVNSTTPIATNFYIESGDYIGVWMLTVAPDLATSGGDGCYRLSGNFTAGDNRAYTWYANGKTAIYGVGATTEAGSPTVTIVSSSVIDGTTANVTGNITDTGGDNCFTRGWRWTTVSGEYSDSTGLTPVTGNFTEDGDFGIGTFELQGTDLPPSRQIYFETLAINSVGASYSAESSFNTTSSIKTGVVSLELTANFETIGVYASFSSDNNSSNNASMEWSPDGGVHWYDGMAMAPDRRPLISAGVTNTWANQYRDVLLGCSANSTYSIRVTFTDSDGVIGTNPIESSITTRSDTFPLGSGSTYYLSASGNDSDPGTLSNPWMTFQHALDTVAAGDTVYVRDVGGNFTGESTITVKTSGVSGNFITFMNYASETPTLDLGGGDNPIIWAAKSYNHWKGINVTSCNTSLFEITGDSSYNVFEYMTLSEFGYGVPDSAFNLSGTSPRGPSFNLFQHNTFTSGHNTYTDSHHRPDCICMNYTNGVANVIRYNNAYGTDNGTPILNFDNSGLADFVGGINNFGVEDGPYKDCDIYSNNLSFFADDALELEGANICVRAWDNYIYNSYLSNAGADCAIGPKYFFRNTIYVDENCAGLSGGMNKIGRGYSVGQGYQYFIHNTYLGEVDGAFNGFGEAYSGYNISNFVTRNNIFNIGHQFLTLYTGMTNNATLSFDYDLWNTTYASVVKWQNSPSITYTTWDSFKSATSQELNSVSGNATFIDPASGNFSLQAGSLGIDTGELLLGFNDANSPWPYVGSSPDIGAYEYSGEISAPTVTTQAASNIGETTATGNGNITATGGENCDYQIFEWGTSTGVYTANNTNLGSFSSGAFTISVTGLPSGTTIYGRAGAHNSAGWGYGSEVTFLTKPTAPTNVTASDGDSTENVTITWDASVGADGYWVLRNSVDLVDAGGVVSYTDTTASAPTITSGAADASDGTSNTTITVSITGQSVNNGTTYTYTLKAYNATGNSTVSSSDTGYRGVGALSYQLQRSAADSDASYSNILGATSSPYSDVLGVSDTGYWYKWVLDAAGASQQLSTADRGYTSANPSSVATTYISSSFKDIYVLLFILLLIIGVLMIMYGGFVDNKDALMIMIGIGIAMIIASYLIQNLQATVTSFW